ETQTVKLLVKDDNKLGSLKVVINNGEKELTWTQEELEKLDGEITFTLDNSTETQSIQVICVDAATNETTVEVVDILITTSAFVQMYNNSLLFYILAGVLGLIILTIIIIIIVKRKKDDDEEEVIDVESLLKSDKDK
ncbi:MAG: GGIII-like transmembrane region-containing protein, partial [Acutalibacteraceae bacterium]